jgi:uncharacterized protein
MNSPAQSTRLVGLDIARALAVFGMVIVNFKIAMGAEANGADWLVDITSILSGRAAALFVILAGIGMSLLSKRAREEKDLELLAKNRSSLLRRAAALFVFGLLFTPIWPADILHFYGVYIAIGALMLQVPNQRFTHGILLLMLAFPIMLATMDYSTEWTWETLHYEGFWTPFGFVRHLFFNGFHPVIPWLAFLLLGMRLGRADLSSSTTQLSMFRWGVGVAFVVELHSHFFYGVFTMADRPVDPEIAQAVFGTEPMPPMPLYMLAAASWAIATIAICLHLGQRFGQSKLSKALSATGQLALTLYVAHVVLGLGILEAIDRLENQTLEFSVLAALTFCIVGIAFATIWLTRLKRGPLEIILRKLSG